MSRKVAIREIFLGLDRAQTFPVSRVTRLVSMTQREVRRRIKAGEIDGYRRGADLRIPWSDVAMLAFEACSLGDITEELGDDAVHALPHLVKPRPMMLMLPQYQIEMLQHLALQRGKSPDWVLTEHLNDLAASVAPAMEVNIPGFIAAMRWPDA